MGKYFGTDGVRGVANQELTPELAFKLGRYGGYVLAHNKGEKHPRVLVGRDTRVSGEMLESALIAGLISIGAEVMRLGIISTPGVAYLTREMDAGLGVMISASHNPVADNGIKFFGSDVGMAGSVRQATERLQQFYMRVADARYEVDENDKRTKCTIITSNNTRSELSTMYNDKLISRLVTKKPANILLFVGLEDVRE